MRMASLLLGASLFLAAHGGHAAGITDCNSERKVLRCEIKVAVSSQSGTCTAGAQYVIAHRNVDATRRVVLVWVLDDGSGKASRYRFSPDKVGVDITGYSGHFEHPEHDGDQRYKWIDLNPSDLAFDYLLNVQYRVGSQWLDCSSVDPVIVNRD